MPATFTINNTSPVTQVYETATILSGQSFTPDVSQTSVYAKNIGLLADVLYNKVTLTINGNEFSGSQAVDILQTLSVLSAPFSEPTYRTKRDAITAPITVAPNNTINIDYALTEERYVCGGQMLVQNVEFGDYFSAEVNDVNGVIPAPYRPVVCEAHPTVAKYINKEYVLIHDGTNKLGKCEIDTRPLAAKVTAGLYLRVTYTAINTGSDRQIVMNYGLAKKL